MAIERSVPDWPGRATGPDGAERPHPGWQVDMIERGDFVKLVAGGRLMTADRIQGSAVQVSWNTPSGQIGCATYPIHELKAVKRVVPRAMLRVQRDASGSVGFGSGI